MPTISSFSPTTAGKDDLVVINGSGFTDITAVKFGGTAATSFTVVSSSIIVAVVAVGSSGSVTVTNTTGTGTLSGFTYDSTTPACGCPEVPQSCIPAPLIPVCEDPEYCEEVVEDKCIVHKGTNLTNLSAPEGTRLDVILGTINTKLGAAGFAELMIAAINASTELQDLIASTT